MIEVLKGDITALAVDAIVNAANHSLMGGGGVDGAIHRAGGPSILLECKKIVQRQGGCEPGNAVITGAGNLPAKYIIHTVGPIWRSGSHNEPKILSECYRNSLQLALDYNCRSVSFPNISTGVYGFPKDFAATIAVRTIKEFLAKLPEPMHIFLVCFDDANYQLTCKEVNG